MAKKSMTNEEYKERCVALHGDKYILDKVQYVDMHSNVTPICKKHGLFSINAYGFSHDRGCPHCGRENKKQNPIKTCGKKSYKNWNKEIFIQEATKLWKGRYVYDEKLVFTDMYTKVKIFCPICGDYFEQEPYSHIRGFGCDRCGKKKMGQSQTISQEEFIKRSIEIYGDKIDRSLAIYKGCYEYVTLICNVCGNIYKQKAYSHLGGHGCPKCANNKNSEILMMTTKEFVEKSKERHKGENNDYSKVDYHGARIPVKITCKKGHTYWQMPYKHLQGHGCPYCCKNISKGEKELLEFIQENIQNEIITNNRKLLDNAFEIDIFIPSENLGIEYDGLHWHNDSKKDNNAHLNKTINAEEKGIDLIHVFEDEWMYKKDAVKSKILSLLNRKQGKIIENNFSIKTITKEESNNFAKINSLSMNVGDNSLGLFYNGLLCATISWIVKNDNEYHIIEYSVKNYYYIPNGLKSFIDFIKDNYTPKVIYGYVDRRWGKDNQFSKLNFSLDRIILPRFTFTYQQKRYNALIDIENKFSNICNLNEDNMTNFNINRIYDCGYVCYKLQD